MVAGLRTSLKIGFLSAIIFTSGCVSNSQSGLYGGNFDHEEAAKTRMSLGLTYLQNNNYTQAKKNLDKALESVLLIIHTVKFNHTIFQTN